MSGIETQPDDASGMETQVTEMETQDVVELARAAMLAVEAPSASREGSEEPIEWPASPAQMGAEIPA